MLRTSAVQQAQQHVMSSVQNGMGAHEENCVDYEASAPDLEHVEISPCKVPIETQESSIQRGDGTSKSKAEHPLLESSHNQCGSGAVALDEATKKLCDSQIDSSRMDGRNNPSRGRPGAAVSGSGTSYESAKKVLEGTENKSLQELANEFAVLARQLKHKQNEVRSPPSRLH